MGGRTRHWPTGKAEGRVHGLQQTPELQSVHSDSWLACDLAWFEFSLQAYAACQKTSMGCFVNSDVSVSYEV